MKILTILGARPQFIKAGAVSREIRKQQKEGKEIKEIIVHTGQHYDNNMSDVFFEELHIPKPDYFLGIGGKSHGAMTGEMIIKIEEIIQKEKPDVVLVYGDTNSTLAGAIAASKLHIPIAHVEAGLRSFNMNMPEEINRILTDRVSKWLFCPTDTAVENLKKEGFPHKLNNNDCQIVKKVGDVMYDAALYYRQFSKPPIIFNSSSTHPPINPSSNFILCTIHRAENTDNTERLINIFNALVEISKEVPVLLPLHPRTQKIISNIPILKDLPFHNFDTSSTHQPINPSTHLHIIDPVGYLEMIWLLDHCRMVITDSGGLQKEAYFFGKPCITLRNETEWVELVGMGVNFLVGANEDKIVSTFKKLINPSTHLPINSSTKLYGDGKASERIVKELLNDKF